MKRARSLFSRMAPLGRSQGAGCRPRGSVGQSMSHRPQAITLSSGQTSRNGASDEAIAVAHMAATEGSGAYFPKGRTPTR